MKQLFLFVVSIFILPLLLTSLSYGWQGKMSGMGDPYGLIQDESDFLIHPARIPSGEGGKFYGNGRFTYTNMTDWNYNLDVLSLSTGAFVNTFSKGSTGEEQAKDVLLGAAFSLGEGRAGFFFQYKGFRGDYDGHVSVEGPWFFPDSNYDLASDKDDFCLRFVYGFPLKEIRVGSEIQLSYHREEDRTWIYGIDLADAESNSINSPWWADWDLFPFLIPHDSEYGEALLKGSLEGTIGTTDVDVTLRGGVTFSGDNQYKSDGQAPAGTPSYGYDLDGDVEGWKIGADLWLRYPLQSDLILPLLVRIDVQEKTRDGNGPGLLFAPGDNGAYESQERRVEITAGGGVNKAFGQDARIAAGIYYNYRLHIQNLFIKETAADGSWQQRFDYGDIPNRTEHRVILRLAGERKISPSIALHAGVNGFYGWSREKYQTDRTIGMASDPINRISLNGSHWGIGGSVGGTVVLSRFTIEPFVNSGYQKVDIEGNGVGVTSSSLPTLYRWEMQKSRREWHIGAGFSILFSL